MRYCPGRKGAGVPRMRCVIFIQLARSMWILAWNGEPEPGALSQRLAALRLWPSSQRRHGIH